MGNTESVTGENENFKIEYMYCYNYLETICCANCFDDIDYTGHICIKAYDKKTKDIYHGVISIYNLHEEDKDNSYKSICDAFYCTKYGITRGNFILSKKDNIVIISLPGLLSNNMNYETVLYRTYK